MTAYTSPKPSIGWWWSAGVGLGVLSFILTVSGSPPCYRRDSSCTGGSGGFCTAGTVVCQDGYTTVGYAGQPGRKGPANLQEDRYCGSYATYITAPCVEEAQQGYPGEYTGCEKLDGGGNRTGVCCYGSGTFTVTSTLGTTMAPTGGNCTN